MPQSQVTPKERALQLAEKMAATQALPSGFDRYTKVAAEHNEALSTLVGLIAYHEGYEKKLDRVTTRGRQLLLSVAGKSSPGSPNWWDEKPGPHSPFVSALKMFKLELDDVERGTYPRINGHDPDGTH